MDKNIKSIEILMDYLNPTRKRTVFGTIFEVNSSIGKL